MNNPMIRTIDELGRLNLPAALLHQQGWAIGDEIALICENSMITLELCNRHSSTQHQMTSTIDNLGRITIPSQFMKILNWNTRCKTELNITGDAITVKLLKGDTEQNGCCA